MASAVNNDGLPRQRKANPVSEKDANPVHTEKPKSGRQRTTCWRGLIVSCTAALTVVFLTGLFYRQMFPSQQYPWSIPHEFTREELAKYTGIDGGLILLSILGHVYDVSAGPEYYGPNGGYRFFSGKDASRSYVDGCFNDNCFDPDLTLSGLTKKQLEALNEWKAFYDKEAKYKFVGTLKGWKIGKLADDE